MSKRKIIFIIISTALTGAIIAAVIASFIGLEEFGHNHSGLEGLEGIAVRLPYILFAGFAVVFGADLIYNAYYFLIKQPKAMYKTVMNIIFFVIDCASVAMMIIPTAAYGDKITLILVQLSGAVLLFRFVYGIVIPAARKEPYEVD